MAVLAQLWRIIKALSLIWPLWQWARDYFKTKDKTNG